MLANHCPPSTCFRRRGCDNLSGGHALFANSSYASESLSPIDVVREGEGTIIFPWRINLAPPNYIRHDKLYRANYVTCLILAELVNAVYISAIMYSSKIYLKYTFTIFQSALTSMKKEQKFQEWGTSRFWCVWPYFLKYRRFQRVKLQTSSMRDKDVH